MSGPWEVLLGDSPPEARGQAWLDLGNPEQALVWARRGSAAALAARAEATWKGECARQRAILEANFRAASTRRFPPALPPLAWNEARDLSLDVTWAVWEGKTELVDLRGGLRRIPAEPEERIVQELEAATAQGHPYLLGPSGGARLLERLLAAQPRLFMTKTSPLYVAEPSLGMFRMRARLFDLSGPLAADHLLWFVGEDWAQRLASFLRAQPGIHPPVEARVLAGGLDGEAVRRVLQEAFLWRQAESGRLAEEAARIFQGRTEGDWRAAFAEGARTRVLLVTSRFTTVLQHVTKDLQRAFQDLGCEAITLLEQRDCQLLSSLEIRQKLLSFRPDLVFFLDHLRAQGEGLIPPEIPYVCWVQDRLPCLFEKDWIAQLGPRDFTFSMWPAMTRDLLAAGYPEVLPLPVAADASTYRPPEGPPPPGLRCDVAFVSNLQALRPMTSYPGLVEEAERILRAEGIGYRDPEFYESLLARLEKTLGLTVGAGDREAVLFHLSFDVERWVQRTGPVRWARQMGLDVRVWGKGWEASEEFAPLARGSVAPGEPLRDLYAAARIHLHMNSDTNVHGRVFECLLSGGFILAWAHPTDREPGGLGEALEIGREVETFSGREDFERKVRQYLADEAARRAVSEAGRARVAREHTTVHRAAEILRRVRQRLGP